MRKLDWKLILVVMLFGLTALTVFSWKHTSNLNKPIAVPITEEDFAPTLNEDFGRQTWPVVKSRISGGAEVFTKNYFTLLIDHKSRGIAEYQIKLESMDSASNPKISYDLSYGCVSTQASGYVGYFIFNLPEGLPISQGVQYSYCVEWLDDHQVLIAENVYNTNRFSYYLFDAETKTKKELSSFISQSD